MAEPKKEAETPSEGVRVVDRRRFTPEGNRRADLAEEPRPQEPCVQPRQDVAAAQQAERSYERTRPPREHKMDFQTLVLSLSTTAMYQLGLIGDAASGAPQPDPEAARHTIDMLGVIEEKTRNNLTPEEKRLLDQVLYELRMSYMALSRSENGSRNRK